MKDDDTTTCASLHPGHCAAGSRVTRSRAEEAEKESKELGFGMLRNKSSCET